jgi:hypothetical protein
MSFSLVGVDDGSDIAVRSVGSGFIHTSFGRAPGVVPYIAAATQFPIPQAWSWWNEILLYPPQFAIVRCRRIPSPMVHIENSMILIRCWMSASILKA